MPYDGMANKSRPSMCLLCRGTHRPVLATGPHSGALQLACFKCPTQNSLFWEWEFFILQF